MLQILVELCPFGVEDFTVKDGRSSMKKFILKGGKRAAAVLLTFVMLFTMLPLTAYAEVAEAFTTAAVHLRADAGTDKESLGVISKGTSISVTDMSRDEWYAVELSDGRSGYMYSEFIGFSEEMAAKTTEYVNLRVGPDTTYKSIAVIPQGTDVTVTNMSNASWYGVRLASGTTGYVFSRYLSLGTKAPETSEKPESTDTPESTPVPDTSVAGDGTTAMTTAAVNLRSGPSTSDISKRVVANGTKVTITEKTNAEWYAVTLSNGETGYIFSKYLRVLNSTGSGEARGETTTYVNLRSGPGTNYYSKGTIATGTELKITDRSNPEWFAVELSDGRTGYMFSIYVKVTAEIEKPSEPTVEPEVEATPEPTPEATPEPTPAPTLEPTPVPQPDGVVVKTTAAINLRKGPGTGYDRIQVVAKGTEVKAIAIGADGWYKVQLTDGTTGYFSADYLSIVSGDVNTLETEEIVSGDITTEDDTTEIVPSDTEYVRTTVSSLNLRSGAGTSFARIQSLSSGTVLEVLARTNNGWTKVKTSNGTEGYVSSEYVVKYDPSSAEATLPDGEASVHQYMTLYLDADTNGMVYWSSSDPSVAKVDSGSGSQVFVYGAAPGTAQIVGKNASGAVLTTKNITVTAPEAVRFAYTTPNIITAGEAFDFVAITDTAKTAVKFEVDGVGTYETTSYRTESYGDNTVSVFTCNTTIGSTGTYTVRAYSSTGGGYSTECREFTIVVVSSTDSSVTTTEERRISDKMLDAVAQFEGYRPEVYADTLAGNIPTVGYGFVVNENTSFYNGLTETEAMVMLADTLNRRGYTTQLNKFIQNNGIRMNQDQFDALVSFSYNIGSGYWNSGSKFYIRTILKDNTFAIPETLSAEQPLRGRVSNSDGIKMYDDHSGSAAVLKSLSQGADVNIVEYYRNSDTAEAWYKVTSGDASGWVRSGDISITDTTGLVRDLSYVDGYTLCSNLLEWHRAGGRCINGLYYRRLAEAKVFSHGNFAEAVKGSSQYKVNTYGYLVPSCIK